MKKILTQERLKEVLRYCPDSGIFTWAINVSNVKAGSRAGSLKRNGYLSIRVDRVRYSAHRLVFLYTLGRMPPQQVDHINGIRNDNRLCNLRECSRSFNMQNQKKCTTKSTTGFLGVSANRGKFAAFIKVGDESKYLGLFSNPVDAHNAYLTAKRKYHPGCTI